MSLKRSQIGNSVIVGKLFANQTIEVVEGKDGRKRCSFKLAVGQGYKNKEGEWVKQEGYFPRITAYGLLAERIAEYHEHEPLVKAYYKVFTSVVEKNGEKRYYDNIVLDFVRMYVVTGQDENGHNTYDEIDFDGSTTVSMDDLASGI